MERDATISRDTPETLWKEMPRIARDMERYVKRCHALPKGWKNVRLCSRKEKM
jgi:hypothetical protein